MAYDFQDTFDTTFFSEGSILGTAITGIPNGGTQVSLYADIINDGPRLARLAGGNEHSLKQVVICVSKTDWPTVTKNKDVFNISINGTTTAMKVIAVLSEDDVSYTLALL